MVSTSVSAVLPPPLILAITVRLLLQGSYQYLEMLYILTLLFPLLHLDGFLSLIEHPFPASPRASSLTLVMATEIHNIGDESPPAYPASVDEKKPDAITRADVVDVEGSLDEEGKRLIADRAEATELTPVEAFKWNVEGDQSPCKLLLILVLCTCIC